MHVFISLADFAHVGGVQLDLRFFDLRVNGLLKVAQRIRASFLQVQFVLLEYLTHVQVFDVRTVQQACQLEVPV